MAKSKWISFIAVGCTHGDLMSAKWHKAVMDHIREEKPKLKIHLGDIFDACALRRGASIEEEGAYLGEDLARGKAFLRELKPDIVTLGNHDARFWDFAGAHNVAKRELGEMCVRDLTDVLEEIGAEWVPYGARAQNTISRYGWTFLHGVSASVHADWNHANIYGHSMAAHTHRPGMATGRRTDGAYHINVGCGIDVERAEYAHRHAGILRWKNAFVSGHFSTCGDPNKARVSIHMI